MLVSGKPRLLFVSPRFLFPMNEGGKIRTANTLRHMKGGAFEVTLASPMPAGHQAYGDEIGLICDHFVSWPSPRISRLRRGLALLNRLPISVATDRSSVGQAVLNAALAQRPDVVVVDFPHAAVLLPAAIQLASVLFTHNVEAEIYERHARTTTGIMRYVWRDQARKMARFEGAALRSVRRVIAVSARDAKALQQRYTLPAVDAIDTGVDLDFFAFNAAERQATIEPQGGRIVFTGVMDSPANVDGVQFLLREVWPHITAVRPDAEVVIVGRNPSSALIEAAGGLNCRFTGFVDDIRPYVAGADVSVIPLRVGSGTRIKAFESMAMGRPVVATTIGIEGLDITAGEHYLRADTPADFAAAILRLLAEPTLRETLRQAARQRLEQRFGWSRIAQQFEAICLRAMQP